MAQNANAILDGDQSLFRLGEIEFPLEKEARDGLDVPATQKTARTKLPNFAGDVRSRDSSHFMILNT